MEDMIVHECVFEMCKVLSSNKAYVLSDHVYNVLSSVLSPAYTYAQKTKRLKGVLIRASGARFGLGRRCDDLGRQDS